MVCSWLGGRGIFFSVGFLGQGEGWEKIEVKGFDFLLFNFHYINREGLCVFLSVIHDTYLFRPI